MSVITSAGRFVSTDRRPDTERPGQWSTWLLITAALIVA